MTLTTNIVNDADIKQCDVLLGRGVLCACHAGSMALKVVVASRMESYLKEPGQKPKTRLTLDILHSVHLAGGRFLVKRLPLRASTGNNSAITLEIDCCWYEINDKEARLKVRELFRDCIKSAKKEGVASELLRKLGLTEIFCEVSTFVDIVEHITNSSTIRDYTSSRKDLVEQRVKNESASGSTINNTNVPENVISLCSDVTKSVDATFDS